MIAGNEDVLEALIEAFLMEKGTKEFYSQAAGSSDHPEAKKTFKALSEWEKKHMDFIQFLYQSIQDNREMQSFEEFKNRTEAPVTEAGIPVKDLKNRIEKYTITDETKALTFAMEIEGKAYNLYRKLSQKASDKNAQVVFREMMEQEVKHIDCLKKMREKIIRA